MDDAKCPVMHGALTKNKGTGTSNKEWVAKSAEPEHPASA